MPLKDLIPAEWVLRVGEAIESQSEKTPVTIRQGFFWTGAGPQDGWGQLHV